MTNSMGVMPQAVEQVFTPLKDQFITILNRWALFRRVFGHDEARIHLLNRFCEEFFGYTQLATYLDVTLSLCRFTDPAESAPSKPGHRANCTLERLVNEVRKLDPAFGASLQTSELDGIGRSRKAHFESLRSKRIAHNDLNRMQAQYNGQPTNWPSREQISNMLASCYRVMDMVHQHYIGCPYVFDVFEEDINRSADRMMRAMHEFADCHDADVAAGNRQMLLGRRRPDSERA